MADGWNSTQREIEILQLRETLVAANNRLIDINHALLDYESDPEVVLANARKAAFPQMHAVAPGEG